jgi:hypothetical protein
MFADLDESLKTMLEREVPLPPADVDIVFERPDRDNVARFNKPTVDLFLFDVTENRDLRETGWRSVRNQNGIHTLRWPPLRLDLRYLVTVWAQAVDDEHRLLFHLYRTLRRLAEVPEEAREGAIENQTKALHLLVEDGELKALVDLWGVLDNRMQPGFVLKATVAVDLNGAREAPMVRTSTMRTGRPGHPFETRHRIGGAVFDGEGNPVAGARVLVGGRFAETGEDGNFNIAPVPPGDLDIEVDAAGFGGAERQVSAPANYDVTLEAEPEPGESRRGRGRRRGGGGG